MGVVFRARDLETNQPVAIKLLDAASDEIAKVRFDREARLLAELASPYIVRYIAHGVTPEGLLYLVMEWLDGYTLSQRLSAQPLSEPEARVIGERISEALAVAHERGIVHRDIKPSNIFLRGGRIQDALLLDFGIARGSRLSNQRPTTVAGQIVGTPGYLAPELAMSVGGTLPTPRADIFSLGCVLYEGLAGRPAFGGVHLTAVLAKTLFEKPSPLSQLRPDVSAAFERLIGRMIDKDPEQRPANGSALLAELREFGEVAVDGERLPPAPVAALTSGEQRLVTVVVASASNDVRQPSFEQIRNALRERFEGIVQLPDGTIVAAFTQELGEVANDHAERAIRCALVVKELLPQSMVVVATGRGGFPERLPTGEAVDRAVGLLFDRETSAAQVLADDVTAGLLSARFDLVRVRPGVYSVTSERDSFDATRPLLGQPTPCVGREPELTLLDAALAATIERSVARAILVTGPPGIGKSRLRHEFVRRVQARSSEVQIWIGRSDAMTAGSPFTALSQLMRRVCGISASDDPGVQRAHLVARVVRSVPRAEVPRVAEMLGELCGTPFPAEYSARLRSARSDPRTMLAQITQAFVDFLSAESAQRPLLLILEDLHWGDSLSMSLIETALRDLSERPLLVLALGRPVVEDSFYKHWTSLGTQRIQLGALGKRACERLTRAILGANTAADTVAHIVQHSEGNALYLEELIRAAAEKTTGESPGSVVAMVQARLLQLSTDTRRTLRAASIFGEVFWVEGVRALLGSHGKKLLIEETLTELARAELIERQSESRFPGDTEYHFRHALLREAAYQLLTDADRTLGHCLAGGFLEAAREHDRMVIATHFESGGDLVRALPHFLAAAEQALSGSDLDGALLRVARGLRCPTDPLSLASLRSVELGAHFWKNSWPDAYVAGSEALAQLEVGSAMWLRAAALMLPVLNFLGRAPEFMALAMQVAGVTPPQGALPEFIQAASYLVITFSLLGQAEPATGTLARVQEYAKQLDESQEGLRSVVLFCEMVYARSLQGNVYKTYELARAAVATSERAGDLRNLLFVKGFLGLSLHKMGDSVGAEAALRSSVELAQRLHESLLLTNARIHLEHFLLMRGSEKDRTEALASAEGSRVLAQDNTFLLGQVEANLARAYLLSGQPERALGAAQNAVQCLLYTPAYRLLAEQCMLDALVALGRFDMAVAEARKSAAQLAQLAIRGQWELELRGAIVAALQRGDATAVEEAREQCRIALRELELRASTIPDAQLRERYVRDYGAHRRLAKLAAELGVAPVGPSSRQ